jgi:hypothetical protein
MRGSARLEAPQVAVKRTNVRAIVLLLLQCLASASLKCCSSIGGYHLFGCLEGLVALLAKRPG